MSEEKDDKVSSEQDDQKYPSWCNDTSDRKAWKLSRKRGAPVETFKTQEDVNEYLATEMVHIFLEEGDIHEDTAPEIVPEIAPEIMQHADFNPWLSFFGCTAAVGLGVVLAECFGVYFLSAVCAGVAIQLERHWSKRIVIGYTDHWYHFYTTKLPPKSDEPTSPAVKKVRRKKKPAKKMFLKVVAKKNKVVPIK